MKTSYVFLAKGFEEIEALTVIDIMRRAGMPVETTSISNYDEVEGAHGVAVMTDVVLTKLEITEAEWLILPGGMPGATNLLECGALRDRLRHHNDEGGRIAAICAAPSVVLGKLGLLNGRRATCYPGMEAGMSGAQVVDDMVVVDGNITTGKGPAAAAEFALSLVAQSMGQEVADQVAAGMLLK